MNTNPATVEQAPGLESHNPHQSWTPACISCGEYCSPDFLFHGLCPDCVYPNISHAEAA